MSMLPVKQVLSNSAVKIRHSFHYSPGIPCCWVPGRWVMARVDCPAPWKNLRI